MAIPPIESFDAITNFVRPQYLVRPLLEMGTTAMLFGPSGGGKTFCALDLACRVATGLPWAGMDTRCAPVVYINAEGGRAFGRRVRAWYRYQIGHNPTHAARLTELLQTNLYVIRGAVQMGGGGSELRELATAIRAIIPASVPLGAIFIDTVARCAVDVDENSASEMTKLVDSLVWFKGQLRSNGWLDHLDEPDEDEAHEPVTFLVHHTGKNVFSEATGRMVERGSSALRAALDVVIGLEPSVPAALVVHKMKDGEEPLPMAVTWDDNEVVGVDDRGVHIRSRVALVQPPGSARSQEEQKKLAKAQEMAEVEGAIMRLMVERPDCTLQELADDMDMSKTTISRRVAALKKSGRVTHRKGEYQVVDSTVPNSPFVGGTTH